MKKNLFPILVLFFCGLFFAQEGLRADSPLPVGPKPTTLNTQTSSPKVVGQVFGQPVSGEEFDSALKTVSIFSTSPKEASTEEEKRQEAWKHIIFLREAQTRNVTISPEDFDKEISRLLQEKSVKRGSLVYFDWVEKNFGEDAKTFEARLENLMRAQKLLHDIMNPAPPKIKEEDAKQKYLNQYNSMATEFVNFPTLEEAQKFYKETTIKKWDEEKLKNAKFSTPTGHISLEAVIDLWKVPTEDAYRIHAMKIDQISSPAKMYKGYGVFRLKEKKDADPKLYDEKKKKEYIKTLEQIYYYENSQKIVQDIIRRADLKDYQKDKVIIMETSAGTVELTLYPTVAPKTCENFIKLAEKGYYNGIIFHRVIKGFMIQGGDPTASGRGGESIWGKPFEDEVRDDIQFEKRGILAMANSGPNTNGSQFFITLAPTPHLNKRHTIFGEVTTGYETIQKIGDTATDSSDRPKTDQKIIKMYLKKWPGQE